MGAVSDLDDVTVRQRTGKLPRAAVKRPRRVVACHQLIRLKRSDAVGPDAKVHVRDLSGCPELRATDESLPLFLCHGQVRIIGRESATEYGKQRQNDESLHTIRTGNSPAVGAR